MARKFFPFGELASALGRLIYSFNELEYLLVYIAWSYIENGDDFGRTQIARMSFDDLTKAIQQLYNERNPPRRWEDELFELLKEARRCAEIRGRFAHTRYGWSPFPGSVATHRITRGGKLEKAELPLAEIQQSSATIHSLTSRIGMFFREKAIVEFSKEFDALL